MSVRDLPPVDALAAQVDAPRALAVAAARAVLAERRAELLAGASDEADLGARARAWVQDVRRPSLRRVINATGVIVHTNLGRAPLAAAAQEAVARVAAGYGNLELDLSTGARGSRHAHVEGAAALAHRRGGGDRGQQRRGGGAAGGGGAGRPEPRGDRLARAAGGDRRRLPGARRDRPGGRAARRGRDDQPHAARRLRGGLDAGDGGGAAGAPVELPPARVRLRGADRGAVRARRAGDRRRRLGRVG